MVACALRNLGRKTPVRLESRFQILNGYRNDALVSKHVSHFLVSAADVATANKRVITKPEVGQRC